MTPALRCTHDLLANWLELCYAVVDPAPLSCTDIFTARLRISATKLILLEVISGRGPPIYEAQVTRKC